MSDRAMFIGRYAVVPATVEYKDGWQSLRVDLTDVYCLSFDVSGQHPFRVSRDGLQSLLDAYDDMQARLREQLLEHP